MGIFLADGTTLAMEDLAVQIQIDNGVKLAPVMLLDKDGNQTCLMWDCKAVLCFGVDGLWYEVFPEGGYWISHTVH